MSVYARSSATSAAAATRLHDLSLALGEVPACRMLRHVGRVGRVHGVEHVQDRPDAGIGAGAGTCGVPSFMSGKVKVAAVVPR